MEENKNHLTFVAKITKDKFQKLLDKTLRFISLRPRSEKEIKDYLKRKLLKRQAAASLVGKIMASLKKTGVLDDEAFAAWWVEQRATFRPKGKIALVMELRQKGVEKEIIDKVVGEKVDELPLARRVAEKKLKVCKNLSPLKFRQKMFAFLSRRGFSWEAIKQTLDEIVKRE